MPLSPSSFGDPRRRLRRRPAAAVPVARGGESTLSSRAQGVITPVVAGRAAPNAPPPFGTSSRAGATTTSSKAALAATAGRGAWRVAARRGGAGRPGMRPGGHIGGGQRLGVLRRPRCDGEPPGRWRRWRPPVSCCCRPPTATRRSARRSRAGVGAGVRGRSTGAAGACLTDSPRSSTWCWRRRWRGCWRSVWHRLVRLRGGGLQARHDVSTPLPREKAAADNTCPR